MRNRPRSDDRKRHQQRTSRKNHQLRPRQSKNNRLSKLPTSKLHRPRRSRNRRPPPSATLHALPPGPRRKKSNRPRRTHPRLVPNFIHGHLLRLGRPNARRRQNQRLGPTKFRLSSE